MNWETLSCPTRSCRAYGRPFGQGRRVKKGTRHGKNQGGCRWCGRSVSWTDGTADGDREAEPAIFERTGRAVAEGNAIHRTARSVPIDQDTGCTWLNRAAHPGRLVLLSHGQNRPVTACHRDECWSLVHPTDHPLAAAKRWCERYGDAWVWVALAPACRLVVACVVGTRTPAPAN